MKLIPVLMAISLAFLVGGPATLGAQTKPVTEKAKQATEKVTGAQADRELMAKIRRTVVEDKSLSTEAHNVKIYAKGGKVTLKGQVRTQEEKYKVAKIATDAAGAGNVTDEMTIKPATPKKGT
jgi:hyperosmotically inducible protein